MTLYKGAKLALLNSDGTIVKDGKDYQVCHREFEVIDYGVCACDHNEILIRVKITK